MLKEKVSKEKGCSAFSHTFGFAHNDYRKNRFKGIITSEWGNKIDHEWVIAMVNEK
jgi:hypothetical protein